MAMSGSMKEEFKRRMSEQLGRNAKLSEEKIEEEKKKAVEAFAAFDTESVGDNQKMFSDLFFDPSEIGMPDFPVDTFHHLHDTWPEWVVNSVPTSDPNYQWNKRAVYEFVANDDGTTKLVGWPSTGKTSLPKEVAALTGRPVFKQSFQQDLEFDEWIMSKEIDDKGTHWKLLPFVQSMEFPFYAVLDEIHRLRRGGQLLLNRLLDEGGTMQLRDGREVVPHPQWRAIGTDNAKGMGDNLDMFDGDVSDISTNDRFKLLIEVDYLPHDQQVTLVMSWFPKIDKDIAESLVTFGEQVQAAFKKGAVPLPWTNRRMKAAADMAIRYRNLAAGIKSAYYNFLAEDSHKQLVAELSEKVGIAALYGKFE